MPGFVNGHSTFNISYIRTIMHPITSISSSPRTGIPAQRPTISLPLNFENSSLALRDTVCDFLINNHPESYRITAGLIKIIYELSNLDELNKFILHAKKTTGIAPTIKMGVAHEIHALGLTLLQFSDGTVHLAPNPAIIEDSVRDEVIHEAIADFLPGSCRAVTEKGTRTKSPVNIIQQYSGSISICQINEVTLRMMLKSNSADQEYLTDEAQRQGKLEYLTDLASSDSR